MAALDGCQHNRTVLLHAEPNSMLQQHTFAIALRLSWQHHLGTIATCILLLFRDSLCQHDGIQVNNGTGRAWHSQDCSHGGINHEVVKKVSIFGRALVVYSQTVAWN